MQQIAGIRRPIFCLKGYLAKQYTIFEIAFPYSDTDFVWYFVTGDITFKTTIITKFKFWKLTSFFVSMLLLLLWLLTQYFYVDYFLY